DLPRIDYVPPRDLAPETDAELVRRFRTLAPAFDVIVVSDQAEIDVGGAVTPGLREAIAESAESKPRKTVWVDSRARAERFRSVLLKLNREEAEDACHRLNIPLDHQALRRYTSAPTLIVTSGAEGAIIIDHRGVTPVPARRVEQPVDICGAGDSFNAGASLMLTLTGDAMQAASFGNLIASITIMKSGTGTATPGEVIRAFQQLGEASCVHNDKRGSSPHR